MEGGYVWDLVAGFDCTQIYMYASDFLLVLQLPLKFKHPTASNIYYNMDLEMWNQSDQMWNQSDLSDRGVIWNLIQHVYMEMDLSNLQGSMQKSLERQTWTMNVIYFTYTCTIWLATPQLCLVIDSGNDK